MIKMTKRQIKEMAKRIAKAELNNDTAEIDELTNTMTIEECLEVDNYIQEHQHELFKKIDII